MAWRGKIGPDEAEPDGCGGPTVEGENEVWPDFHRNPPGRGQFSRFRCYSSLTDTRYVSILAPRTRKNWLPAPPPRQCEQALGTREAKQRSGCARDLDDLPGADLSAALL